MSKIEIVNRALMKLGEPPVSSLNDMQFGKSYEIIYDDIKELLLSSYPWRFSLEIKRLAMMEEKYGNKYMYKLPLDCLLLVRVLGGSRTNEMEICLDSFQTYEVVNNTIVSLTDKGVVVEYVKNIDDDMMFTALFREAMAAKIAAELSMRIKHSISIKQMLENEFLTLIRQAELNNEIIKDTELMPDSSWVLVRSNW
jgi:hypothetical protein